MRKVPLIIAILVILAIVIGIGIDWTRPDSQTRIMWQQAVVPGKLSESHAFLSNNCAACHTPVKGVEPALCIACHADNTALLQRQPTAFHANIQVCSGCHVEHQGTARMPTTMDHALLAKVGRMELSGAKLHSKNVDAGLSHEDMATAAKLFERIPIPAIPPPVPKPAGAESFSEPNLTVQLPSPREMPLNHPRLGAGESALNCASCHITKDRHQGLFGASCAQCHATTQWTITEFRHPSLRSTECAQCHKPPPSHSMMHFPMMSAPMARQPNAKVNQCYLCHQSTSWNDIKGLGWIKHH